MLQFPILNDNPGLFAWCFFIGLLFSLAMLLLAWWRRWSAVTASVITVLWIVLLLPDLWHYLSERLAPPDAIVEPLYRDLWIRGYILIFMPLPFLLAGLYLRRRRTI
jgi:hypothetical protein